jgi:hypothetical protein
VDGNRLQNLDLTLPDGRRFAIVVFTKSSTTPERIGIEMPRSCVRQPPATRSHPRPLVLERLGLSPDTVKTHTSALYRKLGARGRQDAVARALGAGLIPPPA